MPHFGRFCGVCSARVCFCLPYVARGASSGLVWRSPHPIESCKSSLLVISVIGLVQLCHFLRSIIVSRICQIFWLKTRCKEPTSLKYHCKSEFILYIKATRPFLKLVCNSFRLGCHNICDFPSAGCADFECFSSKVPIWPGFSTGVQSWFVWAEFTSGCPKGWSCWLSRTSRKCRLEQFSRWEVNWCLESRQEGFSAIQNLFIRSRNCKNLTTSWVFRGGRKTLRTLL